MQILPIDLTSVIAVVMGTSIVLIPIIGLTARFALKPTVEALARVFETRGTGEAIQIMERRIALLESQLEAMETHVSRLEEVSTFHAQLDGTREEQEKRLPGSTPQG